MSEAAPPTRWAPDDVVSFARMGDAGARDALVAAIWPHCFRLAASVIGDLALAQDAAQEACVAVHRSIRTLRDAHAFDAWIYRIVMREAIRIRSRRQREDAPHYEALADEAPHGVAIDVWRALARLPRDQRDVIVLFYFDDLQSGEIAGILRIPHATVRTRLARARERLRAILGDYSGAATPALQEKECHAF